MHVQGLCTGVTSYELHSDGNFNGKLKPRTPVCGPCQCKDSTDSASVPTGLQSATSADAAPFTAQCVHGQHWNATAISFYCHLLDHKCVCVGVRRSSRHSVCSYGCSYGCSFSFFVRLVLLAFSYGLLACSYGLTA